MTDLMYNEELKKIPVMICIKQAMPNKNPKFQKKLIWRGQGYD